MMYEEQDILRMDYGRRRQVTRNRRDGVEEASSKLEIVDLSGMCLDALPNPSMNLATICKLDISNNNLQATFFSRFQEPLKIAGQCFVAASKLEQRLRICSATDVSMERGVCW